MSCIKSISLYINRRIIHLGLVAIFILFILYLINNQFRLYLSNHSIDPNFVIGFVTTIAIFLSLIQNLNDKKYTYNLKLIDSIEDKGLKIISKLITIKTKSFIFLTSAKHCIEAKKNNYIFKDLSNSLSREDVESDLEIVAAYVDTYFREYYQEWNNLQDKLTEIANLTQPILINYEVNINLIQSNTPFQNQALDNADTSLAKAEKINQEIEDLSFKIRNGIVKKMNETKNKIKNNIYHQ